MKTRKMLLVLALVIIFLLGSVLAVSAKDKIRVTGGFNNTFFGMGWEWIDVNIMLDPTAPATDNAEGKVRYTVYVDDGNPMIKESWEGEPICGELGEFLGAPTVSLVVKIVEVKNIPNFWVGRYAKITMTDGGQNASEDILGITVWDFYNNTPVLEQPSCEFAEPFLYYPSQNGNLMIHN